VGLPHVLLLSSPRSVLEPEGEAWRKGMANLAQAPAYFGPGFYFSAVGLLLLGIGLWRLGHGLTPLPVRFEGGDPEALGEGREGTEGGLGRAILLFSLMACALPAVLTFLDGLAFTLFPEKIFKGMVASWVGAIFFLVYSSVPTLCAFWVFRGNLKAKLQDMCRLSPPRNYALALGLPVLVIGGVLLLYYFAARRVWVSGPLSEVEPIRSYMLPVAWLALLVVAAFLEEIGWRGYLQPAMVDRFGIRRGIFLVGLVWGAFHLAGELGGSGRLPREAAALTARLAFCVVFAVALGWLRLYSGSILPVAVMHATFNILNQCVDRNGISFQRPGATWALRVAWGVIGYLLFRYWPPRGAEQPSTVDPAP
jgi:membrane protease YdiL (CAAX protease family)